MKSKSKFSDVWGMVIIAVLFLTLFISCSVPTPSMAPTINIGDRFVTVRRIYCDIDAQDIITFKYPDDESVFYCKRVIGTPGDVVESKDGIIYVNSTQFEENYVEENAGDNWIFYIPKKGDKVDVIDNIAYIDGYYVGESKAFLDFYCEDGFVKDDCYFCMGDNRTNSLDSRYWNNHFVMQGKIKSEVKLCYFSKDIRHLGIFDEENKMFGKQDCKIR